MIRFLLFLPLLLLFPATYSFAQTLSMQDHMNSNHDSVIKQMGMQNMAPPYYQMKHGIESHMIQCKEGLGLYMKAHGYNPVCIKTSSADKLISRGWLLQHDMTHSEISMGMSNR